MPPLLTYREAAAQLRVSLPTLKRLVKARAFPVVWVSSRRRAIASEAVEKFLGRRTLEAKR